MESCSTCGCTFSNPCVNLRDGVCFETEQGQCSFCVEGKQSLKLEDYAIDLEKRISTNLNKRYSEVEESFIRENYSYLSRTEIARVLGRTSGAVKTLLDKRLQLRKTKEEILSVMRKSNKGRFRPGSKPANTLGDGVVSLRTDHDLGIQYQWIRTSKRVWVPLHRYIWELVNGPIPKKMIVTFKDGDSVNCLIENLTLISMKDNRIRNSGSTTLTDNYVANTIAGKNGQHLKEDILKNPELIDLKRAELNLRREIKKREK